MKEEPVELASDALRRLRGAMSGMEAPPAARTAALAAYRDRQSGSRRKALMMWAVAAVAACAALAVVGLRWVDRAPVPSPAVAVAPRVPSAAGVPATVESPKERQQAAAKPGQRRARTVVAKRKPADRVQAAREVATDFLPIPYAPPLDPREGGQVIRVRLPGTAMRTVGLPVENGWRDRVPADVVVGGDGIARAVRFVGFTK